MKLLLDTHALLWWLEDDGRLGTEARDLIADPGNDVLISVASLWEIVVKVRIGKLAAEISEIVDAVARDGFTNVNVTPAHLSALARLPRRPEHRDPFDHLLLAQAIAEDANFISDDRHAAYYPVRLIACSSSRTAPPG